MIVVIAKQLDVQLGVSRGHLEWKNSMKYRVK